MKFYDFFTATVIALIVIAIGLPELMDIRAIVIKDFTIVWYILFGAIYMTIWMYIINKVKKNRKKQIIVIISGMILFYVVLVILFSFYR